MGNILPTWQGFGSRPRAPKASKPQPIRKPRPARESLSTVIAREWECLCEMSALEWLNWLVIQWLCIRLFVARRGKTGPIDAFGIMFAIWFSDPGDDPPYVILWCREALRQRMNRGVQLRMEPRHVRYTREKEVRSGPQHVEPTAEDILPIELAFPETTLDEGSWGGGSGPYDLDGPVFGKDKPEGR